jgi:hypothetical protein
MKRFFFFLFFAGLAIGSVEAQQFEGRIVFGISVEGKGADQMAAFMPTSYEYLMADGNMRMKMNGGMSAAMMGDVVVLGEEEKVYMVKDADKTAYLMPSDDEEENDVSDTQVEKMNETAEIAGYTCEKYKVTMKTESPPGNTTQFMWVTKDLKVGRPKGAEKSNGSLFVAGVEGFPMKVETKTMGMTMIMTVEEVEKKSVPASTFEIPSDYEVKDFNPAMFGR